MSPILKTLPWQPGTTPLMLAPMQGLTNRGMRAVVADLGKPDTVFTEFVRVNRGARATLKAGDLKEATTTTPGIPLVVQLIGNALEPLIDGALALQDAGVEHINLNLGCPYGRMTTGPTGGGVLKEPERLNEMIPALRKVVTGTFSVKIRAGYEDPQQIFSLLPLFAGEGIDFLVLHPRTVKQEYTGLADHHVTRGVVEESPFPVIANGDITTALQAEAVLKLTGAAGLMIGRGGVVDPRLFERIRGNAARQPSADERLEDLCSYLRALLIEYRALFCGETQILCKVKAALSCANDPDLDEEITRLKRARQLGDFEALICGGIHG